MAKANKALKAKSAKSATYNKGVRKIMSDIRNERKKISDTIEDTNLLLKRSKSRASKINYSCKSFLKVIKKQQ